MGGSDPLGSLCLELHLPPPPPPPPKKSKKKKKKNNNKQTNKHKKKQKKKQQNKNTKQHKFCDRQLPLCCCKVSLGIDSQIYRTCIRLSSASILYDFIQLCVGVMLFIKYTNKVWWNQKWCPFLWDSRQAAMQYGHARVSPVNWQNTLISCILIWTEPWKKQFTDDQQRFRQACASRSLASVFPNTCETTGCTRE